MPFNKFLGIWEFSRDLLNGIITPHACFYARSAAVRMARRAITVVIWLRYAFEP